MEKTTVMMKKTVAGSAGGGGGANNEEIRPVIDSKLISDFIGQNHLKITGKGATTTYFSANIANGGHYHPVPLEIEINNRDTIEVPLQEPVAVSNGGEQQLTTFTMRRFTDEELLDTFWLEDTQHHQNCHITDLSKVEIRIGELLRHKLAGKSCTIHVNYQNSTTNRNSEKASLDGPKDILFEFYDGTKVYASILGYPGHAWKDIVRNVSNYRAYYYGSPVDDFLRTLHSHGEGGTNSTCFIKFEKISLSLEYFGRQIGLQDEDLREKREKLLRLHEMKDEVAQRVRRAWNRDLGLEPDTDMMELVEARRRMDAQRQKVTQECYNVIRYLWIADSSGRDFGRVVDHIVKIRQRGCLNDAPAVLPDGFYEHERFEEERRNEEDHRITVGQDLEERLETTVNELEQLFKTQEEKTAGTIINVRSLCKIQKENMEKFQVLVARIESLRSEKRRRWVEIYEREEEWWFQQEEVRESLDTLLQMREEHFEQQIRSFEQDQQRRRQEIIDAGNEEALAEFEEQARGSREILERIRQGRRDGDQQERDEQRNVRPRLE